MTIEIITYHVASGNPKPGFEWTAYVVLPNGEYWGVRFNGSTEELARSKAIALWMKERSRLGVNANTVAPVIDDCSDPIYDPSNKIDPWAETKPHHLTGKVWMRNGETLKRVALTEIALYEKNGYHRSSPRGK